MSGDGVQTDPLHILVLLLLHLLILLTHLPVQDSKQSTRECILMQGLLRGLHPLQGKDPVSGLEWEPEVSLDTCLEIELQLKRTRQDKRNREDNKNSSHGLVPGSVEMEAAQDVDIEGGKTIGRQDLEHHHQELQDLQQQK